VRMRAAENRRWILRATNNGITASVDPAGRVVKRLPSYQEADGVFSYSLKSETTPYTRYGDWFAWGCWLVAGVTLFASQLPHYKAGGHPPRPRYSGKSA
jgi:apolipoprotein N-acyltransferase